MPPYNFAVTVDQAFPHPEAITSESGRFRQRRGFPSAEDRGLVARVFLERGLEDLAHVVDEDDLEVSEDLLREIIEVAVRIWSAG